MNNKILYSATAMVFVLSFSFTAVTVGANADGPSWANNINSNGRVMQQEVGNYTISEFNSDVSKFVFDMEDVGGKYPVIGATLESIILHSTLGSPINKRIYFDGSSPFGRVLTNTNVDNPSSGNVYLAYNSANQSEITIRFTDWYGAHTPAYGVGFVMCRIVADVTVTLYDSLDSAIYTNVIPGNSGTGMSRFSFFGYAGSKDIAKIVLGVSSLENNEYYIDDFGFVTAAVAPPVYQQGDINSNNIAVEDEAGNYGIDQFNDNPRTVLLDFDDPWGIYPGAGSQVSSIPLTDIEPSSANVVVSFDAVSPYGRIMDDGAGRQSSGAWSLTYNTRNSLQAVIRFNKPVYGVGFMINRIFNDCPVTIYGQDEFGADVEIVSYTAAANTNPGTGFSWFGYYNYQAAEITKLVIDTTLQEGNQWWLDDLAVIAELPCSANANPGDINKDCVVDSQDIEILASGWLECNPDYAGCQ